MKRTVAIECRPTEARIDKPHDTLKDLHALARSRELLMTWTLREVKVRYRQSVLGVAWAIFQPLSLMLVYTAIFAFFLQVPSDGVPYPIFLYSALLPWTFFAAALTSGSSSLVNNLSLVTKIYFPREILPLAAIGVALVDFLVAASLFVLLLAWYQVPTSWSLLWLPLVVLVQLAFTLGVVLPCAALNVLYRDIRFLVPLAIQLWLYLTPVIYSVTVVPETYRLVYSLNPLVGIMDAYRRVTILGVGPDPLSFGISTAVSILLPLLTYRYFKAVEDQFADLI